ncbi:arrestin domain-containing protein 3-like [Gigantopelta aegis]|uniref:arrestin domain-containing protein 3-like n=1 Tax=Gigantopelta aegis TaxID=1735272 RepID=UPI001B88E21C|nr:arrestin domain-containing protein 3-like [Gigantopelta aegis]
MGKISVFEIVLSNPQGVYFTGQVLQGHVILELTEIIKLRGIRISFRGKAFVHWTDQSMRGAGQSRFREVRHHSATEEYLDISLALLARGSKSEEKKILPPGQYTYPFQIELPYNLPSSFEGQFGFVRYWVVVNIEKPWNTDYSVKKVFTVICPVDLNREPTASTSSQCRKQKRMCCLCCRSGPVCAELCVNQKGYVPGEPLYINAEVTNLSRRKMGVSSVALRMSVVFHTPGKSRSVTQQVCKMKHGQVPAGETDLWEGEKMVIPPLPPSFLLGCNIIDIKYTIELRVDPVGPAFDLCVPVDIIIGTIPIQSSVQKYLAASRSAVPTRQVPRPLPLPPLPLGAAPPGALYENTPVLAPHFVDYVFGKRYIRDDDNNGDHARGDVYFCPQYVYYRLDIPANQHTHRH